VVAHQVESDVGGEVPERVPKDLVLAPSLIREGFLPPPAKGDDEKLVDIWMSLEKWRHRAFDHPADSRLWEAPAKRRQSGECVNDVA